LASDQPFTYPTPRPPPPPTLFPYTTLFRSAQAQKPIRTSMGNAETSSERHQLGVSSLPTTSTLLSLSRGSSSGSYKSGGRTAERDRKSTRLNSSHQIISYAVFCLKKKNEYK